MSTVNLGLLDFINLPWLLCLLSARFCLTLYLIFFHLLFFFFSKYLSTFSLRSASVKLPIKRSFYPALNPVIPLALREEFDNELERAEVFFSETNELF